MFRSIEMLIGELEVLFLTLFSNSTKPKSIVLLNALISLKLPV